MIILLSCSKTLFTYHAKSVTIVLHGSLMLCDFLKFFYRSRNGCVHLFIREQLVLHTMQLTENMKRNILKILSLFSTFYRSTVTVVHHQNHMQFSMTWWLLLLLWWIARTILGFANQHSHMCHTDDGCPGRRQTQGVLAAGISCPSWCACLILNESRSSNIWIDGQNLRREA